jgi:hypothetical protein
MQQYNTYPVNAILLGYEKICKFDFSYVDINISHPGPVKESQITPTATVNLFLNYNKSSECCK